MTLYKFLQNVTKDENRTELEKAVSAMLTDGFSEETADELETYVNDVAAYGCASGSVSGLIYYTDTHVFYNEHADDIDDLLDEAEENNGEPVRLSGDRRNAMAWFGFEETTYKLYGEWENQE